MITNNDLSLKAKRGLSLNGYDYEGGLYLNPQATKRVDVDKQNRDYILALASAETNLSPNDADSADVKSAKEKALNMVRDALAGDRQALRSLNALRLTTSDNYIKASSNFLSFFEIVTLKDDERPGVKYTSQNEISCGYVAQDGKPRQRKIEPHRAHDTIPLRIISSDRVGYYTRDIYDGSNIAEMAKATFEIAFDLTFKIDRECFNLLNATVGNGGVYGAFTLTGARASRLYVPHSGIVTAHLPQTNDITVYTTPISGDGTYNDPTSGIVKRFGVRCLQEIIRYSESWGQWSPQGKLVPTGEIVVPSSDIFAILMDLTVVSTSGGRPNETELERQVAESGFMELEFPKGRMWKFTPDVTIQPGKCFPKFNKVPGQVFFKPSQDQEFTFPEPEKNYEERSQQKVFGAYVLNHWRMNALRLTYK